MDLFNELKKLKILLIDDDDLVRDSLALFFKTDSKSEFKGNKNSHNCLWEQGGHR